MKTFKIYKQKLFVQENKFVKFIKQTKQNQQKLKGNLNWKTKRKWKKCILK